MDLHTDKGIHVSSQTELNSTELKIFPHFRNNQLGLVQNHKKHLNSAKPVRFGKKTETNAQCAGGIFLTSIKLHNNSKRIN